MRKKHNDEDTSAEHPFGPPNRTPDVVPTFIQHADRREAAEAEEHAQSCVGCRRRWIYARGSGRGQRTRIIAGQYWHYTCYHRIHGGTR